MRIWNLTPHVMYYDDGVTQREFPSDGVLRLDQSEVIADNVDGLATVVAQYGKPHGVPDGISAGDVLLVSTLIGDVWKKEERPHNVTILVPDTGPSCKRNAEGRIVSVTRFIRK